LSSIELSKACLVIDPSSLSRWRKRPSKVGIKERLVQRIEAAKRAKVIKPSIVKRVDADTKS
jgi:IS5 family transposase